VAKEKTNKDRLICIEGLLQRVLEWQGNHQEHHKKLYDRLFRVFLVVLGAALAATSAILISVF
jgi:hypothetical protein